MSRVKVGEVVKPSANRGERYTVYWDKSTGDVYVENRHIGRASSESQALHLGDVYTSTH